MQFTVNLPAGQWVQQQTAGRFFMLVEDGGQPIQVRCVLPLATDEEVSTARKGFMVAFGGLTQFKRVELKAAVACTVSIVISENDVDFNFFEGANVNATITNPIPVPVSNDRGGPALPIYVSGLTYSDAPATSVTNAAPVAVTAVSTAVLAANVNRKALRFCNLGPDPVALGGPGALTWAKRCIVLDVGDVWVEERGANVAWSAICDAAKTASVTVQEVLA